MDCVGDVLTCFGSAQPKNYTHFATSLSSFHARVFTRPPNRNNDSTLCCRGSQICNQQRRVTRICRSPYHLACCCSSEDGFLSRIMTRAHYKQTRLEHAKTCGLVTQSSDKSHVTAQGVARCICWNLLDKSKKYGWNSTQSDQSGIVSTVQNSASKQTMSPLEPSLQSFKTQTRNKESVPFKWPKLASQAS